MQSLTTLLLLFAASAIAVPHDYPAPPGGWESVKYPPGTGENLEHYPAPPGGWENVKYPPGTGENLGQYPPPAGGGGDKDKGKGDKKCPPASGPIPFTSTYNVRGVPEEVVNGSTNAQPTGGLAGCTGFYDIGINSDLDIICWHIRLLGFQGEYSSPATTATHIHAGARGKTGPPRVVFPDPVAGGKGGNERVSMGCMKGPFVTGVVTDGKDAGEGFVLKQLEDDPAGYYVDVHSSLAVPGANRGQVA